MEKSTHEPGLARNLADAQYDLDPAASLESVLAYFIEQHEASQPVRLDELVARFPQHAGTARPMTLPMISIAS